MIAVSTNMYLDARFPEVFKILDAVDYPLGIELFPCSTMRILKKYCRSIWILQQYPLSFHGPYYKTEHSAPEGTEIYRRTMDYFEKTMSYEEILQPKYVVYHFNNCPIHQREAMIENGRKHLRALSQRYKTPLVIENTGVASAKNVLFDENQFIAICREEKNPVLIDLGHANANHWNIEKVITTLQDKIIAYHLHSNDGFHDNHDRIFQNTPSIPKFLELYRRYTPEADLILEYSPDYAGKEELVISDIVRLIASL